MSVNIGYSIHQKNNFLISKINKDILDIIELKNNNVKVELLTKGIDYKIIDDYINYDFMKWIIPVDDIKNIYTKINLEDDKNEENDEIIEDELFKKTKKL